jgi:hypothetical protein
MPKPLKSFGLQTTSHLTRQIPHLFSFTSSTFQKKFLLNLSIFLINHLGKGKTAR